MSEEMMDVQEAVSGGEAVPSVTRKLEPGAEAAKPRPRQAETRKLEPEAEVETAL